VAALTAVVCFDDDAVRWHVFLLAAVGSDAIQQRAPGQRCGAPKRQPDGIIICRDVCTHPRCGINVNLPRLAAGRVAPNIVECDRRELWWEQRV
jgi:hypothetical protein